MWNPLTKSQFQSPLVERNAQREVGNPHAEGLEKRQIIACRTFGTTRHNFGERPDSLPLCRVRSEKLDELARKLLRLGNAIRHNLGRPSENIAGAFGAAGHESPPRADLH